jgi:hypothetical protein
MDVDVRLAARVVWLVSIVVELDNSEVHMIPIEAP